MFAVNSVTLAKHDNGAPVSFYAFSSHRQLDRARLTCPNAACVAVVINGLLNRDGIWPRQLPEWAALLPYKFRAFEACLMRQAEAT
jgi:hypothetical protein